MKKILLFAVLALVAAGCDQGKKGELVTENYSIVDSVLLRNYVKTIPENSAAKCSVEYDVDLPVGKEFKPLRDSILTWLIGYSAYDGTDTLAIRNDVKNTLDSYVEEYSSIASELEDYEEFWDMMYTNEFNMRGYFLPELAAKDIICYEIDTYSYLGGAHGFPGSVYFPLYKSTLEPVLLTDFVPEEYNETLLYYLYEKFKEEEYDTEYLGDTAGLWTENVYYTEDGITFSYQPYAVAPYCDGIVELSLTWDEIDEMLSKDPVQFVG